MRRLTLLVLALALAFYALFAAGSADPVAGRVRDGLLLVLVAALAFAWVAGPLPPRPITGVVREWALWARLSAALAVALAGLGAILGVGSPLGMASWAAALVALTAGIWWPGERTGYEPPAYRWTTDAAGHWVRAVLGDSRSAASNAAVRAEWAVDGIVPGRRILALPLLIVLAVGVFLRLWRLGDVAAGCIGAECEAALRLAEPSSALMLLTQTSLYEAVAHTLYRITGDALHSLRLAGALIGILTLPAFYWAARALDRAGGAALATMLLALSPWHIWASRTPDPSIAVPFLIALLLGTGLRALASVDRRWWWAAGVAAGLIILGGGSLRGPAILWALALGAAAAWALSVGPADVPVSVAVRIHGLAAYVAAAIVIALPAVNASAVAAFFSAGAGTQPVGFSSLLSAMVHSGGASVDYFLDNPLLAALPAALAVLGIGQLVRTLHWPYAAWLIAGPAFYVGFIVRGVPELAPIAGLSLALLPFLFLAAAVSTDTLVSSFYATWRALVPARYALGGALAIVLVTAGVQVFGFARALDEAGAVAHRSVDEAIGRHAATCLAAESYAACVRGEETDEDANAYRPVIYAPASALAHPSTRLLLGAIAESERLRVLDIARDVPPDPLPDGPALYLTSIEDQPSINLLQEFYPNAEMQALPRTDGPTQFVVVAVDRQDLLERQGIQGLYFTGTDFGTPENANMISRDGPLTFKWAEEPPLPGDFSVLWEGSLQVPASGTYLFSTDLPPVFDDRQSAFTLQLDDRLVLDTSLGLLHKEERLAQGFYRLSMRYRTPSGADLAPENWAVRWQLPGEEPQPIPRAALYSPALPDVGLIATYTGGEDLQGPVLTTRKDIVLGAQADLPAPYSVRWEGKVAAPRAGEYLFAVTGNGSVQMLVNGLDLLTYGVGADAGDEADTGSVEAEAPVYEQASIYLPQGWHDIEIRYVPAETQPSLRILWQPPGSSPSLLPSQYLRPDLGPLRLGDAPMPDAPPLLDPSLGDDVFALSYSNELIQPQRTIPPPDLPPLLFEEVWRTGGSCGAGDGQLNAPRGVVVDGTARRVYVADTGNRRVLGYELESGAPVAAYAAPQFEEPVDLALAPDGALLVLDAVAHPIVRMQVAGDELGDAVPVALDTQFYRPRGLDVDSLGTMLVADTGGARVVMLGSQGEMLSQFGGPGTMLGTGQPVDTLAANGVLWAVTAEDGRLWRLYDQSSLTVMSRANTLDGPHMAGLPDGSFFITHPVDGTVRYYAAGGQPLREFAYPGAFIAPVGVGAAEVDGLVYLAVADSASCAVSVWRGSVR